jgi:hypothetical protein
MNFSAKTLARPHLVHRRDLSEAAVTQSQARFGRHAERLGRAAMLEMTTGSYRLDTGPESEKGYGPFQSAKQFQLFQNDLWDQHNRTQQQTYELRLAVGDTLVAPPYDADWSAASVPFQRFDGKLTLLGNQDFTASGVGIYLESDTAVLASVNPAGTYSCNYGSFGNYPGVRSRGGLGMLVYEGDATTPSHVHQSTLWTKSGAYKGEVFERSGAIAQAPQASAQFGPMTLGPLLFNMQPGVQYQVWVWAWRVETRPPEAGFISVLSAQVPVFSVATSPPILLH